MISHVSCVVRSFNGNNELVRVEDAFNHVVGERVLTGRMSPYTIKSGPSGSHQVRVWAPCGTFVESQYGIASEQAAVEDNVEANIEFVVDAGPEALSQVLAAGA
ncbi:MAG: hypothetical protein P4L53_09800 [Candidatus Obscuribacterales bacterium]|nr:hypothetical protein [Candidatus Obscuribacterales bacterium]